VSLALFQKIPDISLSMQNGNDLKRRCFWSVHNGVVWISGKRPETKGTGCEVYPGMTAHGSFGSKCASMVDRSFYVFGSVFVGLGNV
jgi:hypothetical protein